MWNTLKLNGNIKINEGCKTSSKSAPRTIEKSFYFSQITCKNKNPIIKKNPSLKTCDRLMKKFMKALKKLPIGLTFLKTKWPLRRDKSL